MTKPIIDTESTALDLRLGWLEAFVATARHLSYERAAIDLGISAKQAKRRVNELEGWLNRVLVLDDTPLELHDADAVWFLPIAKDCLERFSASKTWPGNTPPEQWLRKSKDRAPRRGVAFSSHRPFRHRDEPVMRRVQPRA